MRPHFIPSPRLWLDLDEIQFIKPPTIVDLSSDVIRVCVETHVYFKHREGPLILNTEVKLYSSARQQNIDLDPRRHYPRLTENGIPEELENMIVHIYRPLVKAWSGGTMDLDSQPITPEFWGYKLEGY